MCRVITLTSPSACGKDTILNAVLKINNSVRPIVSTTSRPMRKGEIDGITYNFVQASTAKQMLANGEFIENRVYQVANGQKWIYGITKDSIDVNSNNIYIVIVDFQGLRELEKYLGQYNIKVESVYLDCSAQERLRRSITREGKMADMQVMECCRRLIDDEDSVVLAKDYCKYVLANETKQDYIECTLIIDKLINKNLQEEWRKI